MDFLEKLDYLMKKNNLNKSTLSKACNIPYTTIDGWYKKGYEGLKLTTLRKLADYFGTSLDFWANGQEENISPPLPIDEFSSFLAEIEKGNDPDLQEFLEIYRQLDSTSKKVIMDLGKSLLANISDAPQK